MATIGPTRRQGGPDAALSVLVVCGRVAGSGALREDPEIGDSDNRGFAQGGSNPGHPIDEEQGGVAASVRPATSAHTG